MSRKTHFEKFTDHIFSNDGSELSAVKAERDYVLHCLERELVIAHQARARIEALEAALQKLTEDPPATLDEPDPDFVVINKMRKIALAALDK
jgi:hypothetical protein